MIEKIPIFIIIAIALYWISRRIKFTLPKWIFYFKPAPNQKTRYPLFPDRICLDCSSVYNSQVRTSQYDVCPFCLSDNTEIRQAWLNGRNITRARKVI